MTHASKKPETPEHKRLELDALKKEYWKRWGPYLSERSWGTVREDYSPNGAAWDHLPHDSARSKAYRWGEDGLGGICDRYQLLCWSLALWNTRDPILKERAFGVIPAEGNHGEDVKEYYFYLDSTPTHSYMRYLYKYPQAEFPYQQLVDENRARGGRGFEYELLDTGMFDHDRYFDVAIEYAKASPEDMHIRIEVFNRGPEAATLHVVPQLWFRNTWHWEKNGKAAIPPKISLGSEGAPHLFATDEHCEMLPNLPFSYSVGKRRLFFEGNAEAIFTDNETNAERLYGPNVASASKHVKDAFHRYIVNGEREAVNPARTGSKAGLRYEIQVPANGSSVIRLRLTDEVPKDPFKGFDALVAERKKEADRFYETIHPPKASAEERNVQRQAFAGMLWGKQIYLYDVDKWLGGDDPSNPPPESRLRIRNQHWRHLNSMRILSMPDKWEYPWFAAWDLAFHCVTIGLVDPDFAKEQLWLMLFEQFQHPNGQIPAYEWEFSDLNPPVHAWAVWRLYNLEKMRYGTADRAFLERSFHKLMINFAWWINKVDSQGNNVFEGGFLGLDNITVLDRSEKLPGGAVLEQSDATGWMGMFCLNLMRMALELAKENQVYEGLATKFFQHYTYVGAAMKHMGGKNYSLWDEDDGFFYDVLRYPNGEFHKFKVRSLVGIIPLYAVERLETDWLEPFADFRKRLGWFLKNRGSLVSRCVHTIKRNDKEMHALTIVDEEQLRGILRRVCDPSEFFSDFGMRSLSKYHEAHPFTFGKSEVRYEPAEADCKIKGGNSNWRGPIWFPTSFLLIESMRKLAKVFGDDFKIPAEWAPGGSVTLPEVTKELANRMIRMFVPDDTGHRPIYGGCEKFQKDPHWRNHVLFFEYFHGDNGAGLGASHQTGWTGLVASLIDEWRR